MSEASTTVAEDHALLVAAAREAGRLALGHFNDGVRSWTKEKDGSPVSEADLAIDRLLHDRLLAARPDYGWLSEETEDDPARLGKRRVWIVDPIDGTRAFLKQIPEFAVSAALVEDGRPIAGVVFNPATDEFFEATRGGGARLNGVPIKPSGETELARAHYLASRRTLENQDWPRPAAHIKSTWMNSIAYRMVLVGSGRYDAAFSLTRKSDWDIAAADLIVREAGGRSTTRAGENFRFNLPTASHPDVVTAAPGLHQKLLDLLG